MPHVGADKLRHIHSCGICQRRVQAALEGENPSAICRRIKPFPLFLIWKTTFADTPDHRVWSGYVRTEQGEDVKFRNREDAEKEAAALRALPFPAGVKQIDYTVRRVRT